MASALILIRRHLPQLSKLGVPVRSCRPSPPSQHLRTKTKTLDDKLPFVARSTNPKTQTPDGKISEVQWLIQRRWDVPWNWQTVVLTMSACAGSHFLTELVEPSVSQYLGFQQSEASLDEKKKVQFATALCQTTVGLGIIFGITRTFKPLPHDIFRYDLKNPFSLRDGWLLWAGIGSVVNAAAFILFAIVLIAIAMYFSDSGESEDKKDYNSPLIGSSSTSMFYSWGTLGVLAPILEETVCRGFLMVSLTKWFSTPVSVLISAVFFAVAHRTPEHMPWPFICGIIYGFSYAQTRNLLTPIIIHSVWNSMVMLLDTFVQGLKSQGYI